jgi:hypothetical protein
VVIPGSITIVGSLNRFFDLIRAGLESCQIWRLVCQQATVERGETSTEQLDEARHEAHELAAEATQETAPVSQEIEPQEIVQPSKPTKKQLDENFDRSMETIRQDMKPASRAFSKVIHNKVVEKTSDAVANTVARPNLIIAGGLGTLILCSAVYLVAKQYGYVLSGFEAIGTFILGWGIGAIIEFARVGFINQKSQ